MKYLVETIQSINVPEPIRKIYKIGYILLQDMRRCDLFKHASAMAYVTIFSLIPSLAATFTLIALFSPFLGEDSELFLKIKAFIFDNLAAGSGQLVIGHIESFLANLNLTKIGLTGFVGIVISLILLLRQIEIALNRIWLVKRPRNIFKRFVYFWTFITLGTFILGITVGIFSDFSLNNLVPFDGKNLELSHGFFKTLTPWISAFVFFVLLYKVVPNCFVSFKHATIGAIPAAILFILASRTYGHYASITNYREVYGAVAAIPIFLFWLYLNWIIILLGSLLAWRAQQSFDLKDDMDTESPVLTPKEKLRNHHLQLLTPFVVLLAIYQKFKEADGKGVTGLEISTRLNIPVPWILEALEALLEMELVVLSTGQEQGDYITNAFFPACPAKALKIVKLRELFAEASTQWFSEWKYEWPVDLKPAVGMVWDKGKGVKASTNMEDILESLSPKKVKPAK